MFPLYLTRRESKEQMISECPDFFILNKMLNFALKTKIDK